MDHQIILDDREIYKPLFNKKKPYVTTLEHHEKNLLSDDMKDYLIHPIQICFLTENNNTGILFQNFIQRYFFRPRFNNNIILENNTNMIDESIKITQTLTPIEYIIAESKYDFFNFIIEKSINYSHEYIYNKIAGYYLNMTIPSMTSPELTFDKYITPFVIENNSIRIIPKNKILNKSIFAIFPKCTREQICRGIFISGSPEIITEDLITSLKITLDLPETEYDIMEQFNNNYTLIKDTKRENPYNMIHVINCQNENNTIYYSITNISLNLYFTIELEKQKKFIIDLIQQSKQLIKNILTMLVKNINVKITNNVNHDYYETESHKIIKKLDDEYVHIKIPNDENIFYKFLCKNNQILFGHTTLKVRKNFNFTTTKSFELIDDYVEQFINTINNSFQNEIKKIYDKKQI